MTSAGALGKGVRVPDLSPVSTDSLAAQRPGDLNPPPGLRHRDRERGAVLRHPRGEADDRQIASATGGVARVIGPGATRGIHIPDRSAA